MNTGIEQPVFYAAGHEPPPFRRQSEKAFMIPILKTKTLRDPMRRGPLRAAFTFRRHVSRSRQNGPTATLGARGWPLEEHGWGCHPVAPRGRERLASTLRPVVKRALAQWQGRGAFLGDSAVSLGGGRAQEALGLLLSYLCALLQWLLINRAGQVVLGHERFVWPLAYTETELPFNNPQFSFF